MKKLVIVAFLSGLIGLNLSTASAQEQIRRGQSESRGQIQRPVQGRQSQGRSQGRPSSQQQRRQFEQIEAEKVAFITKELQLNPKEAQQFFPIYNQYRSELLSMLEGNVKKMHEEGKTQRSRMDELELESKILSIKKKYRDQFAPIVGQGRASRFFEVEREFREKLLQELNRRRN